jgi:hypothetical protein
LHHWLLTAARYCDLARIAQFVHVATPRRIVHKLTDVARGVWVWVRQPANTDPLVRARTAFANIKARSDIPGLQWLENDVRFALSDRVAMTECLRMLRDDADALLYVVIANVAFERLRSGQHHVARGRLGPRGRQIHAAYKVAAARLLDIGVYDSCSYEAELAFVRHSIEEVG